MKLNESLEVTYTEISADTKKILQTFQDVLKTLLKFYHGGVQGDKRGQIQSLKDFQELEKDLRKFRQYSFMQPVMDQIDQIQQEIKAVTQAKQQAQKIDFGSLRSAINDFKSGNWRSAQSIKSSVDSYSKSRKNPLKHSFNPFYIEDPLIFGSDNFLQRFEQSEIQEVANKDIDVYKYSYIPLNDITQADFQHLAYMILQLSDTATHKQISGKDLKSFFDLTIKNDHYKKLILTVQDYLHDNNKQLIPVILSLIKQLPAVNSANEQSKKNITYLYRGYLDDDGSPENSQFIATSKSKKVARRFALQVGHLEGEHRRRTESGIIDTYKVTPEDIVFDTTIFGGIFGEQEVVIRGDLVPIKTEYV